MERKSALVAGELERVGVDVVALQKTRFAGSGSTRERSYTIFWSGAKEGERRSAGVPFAIKNDLVYILESTPKGVYERIMSLSIPLDGERNVTLICAYAPTMTTQRRRRGNSMETCRRRSEERRQQTNLLKWAILMQELGKTMNCLGLPWENLEKTP